MIDRWAPLRRGPLVSRRELNTGVSCCLPLVGKSDRPSITEAAATWLDGAPADGGLIGLVRDALDAYVAGRYFGAAESLRSIHALRRSLYEDYRLIHEAAGIDDDIADR